MDFNRQNNRPVQRVAPTARQSPQPQTPPPAPLESSPTPHTSTPKKHGFRHAALAAVVVLALLGGGYAAGNVLPLAQSGEYDRVDATKNQAVFLVNDQVYFGKIVEITKSTIVMKEIYYLQGKTAEQPTTGQAAQPVNQQQEMALTKLGNELHGPEDRMQINRDQVLFWENLKSDGKVSEAIKAYKP